MAQLDTDEKYRNCTVSLTNGFATWFVDQGEHGYPLVIGNSYENDDISPLVYTNHSGFTFPLIQSIKGLPYNDTNQYDRFDLTNETQFVATECYLAACVRSIQASVTKSIYNESTLVYWHQHEKSDYQNVTLKPPWGSDLGVQEGQSFGIGDTAFDALISYISTLFSGKVHVLSDDLSLEASRSDILQGIFYGDFAGCDNPLDSVGCAIKNVAKAMSKSFCDTPYMEYGAEDAHMTIGETFVSLTFVRINWRWFAFPVAIWVLSVVTLLGTVWKTRRARVQTWRNSPLPLLFLHHHEDHESSRSYDVSSTSLSTRAQNLHLKLHIPEDNIHVKSHTLD
jgi:hypothetical protein